MNRPRRTRLVRTNTAAALPLLALVAIAAVVLMAPDAMAQLGGGETTKVPPTPGSSDKPPLLLQYGVLAVLVLGTLGLSILKSKREVKN